MIKLTFHRCPSFGIRMQFHFFNSDAALLIIFFCFCFTLCSCHYGYTDDLLYFFFFSNSIHNLFISFLFVDVCNVFIYNLLKLFVFELPIILYFYLIFLRTPFDLLCDVLDFVVEC